MYKNLLLEMKRFKMTNSELAELLQITDAEFEKRIKGTKSFKLNEALIISNFFAQKIASIEYLFK